MVKFLQFNDFMFLVLPGKKQSKEVRKMPEISKQFYLEAMTTFLQKNFGKMHKFEVSSLGNFDEVSVSKF